ncbi:DUF1080 domain-containing protein [Antarcticibacterium arcticum]|uniref:DUF1080 domain-containing protein n=2 Tax=Antarcticibacterium arcticum TaxID=2585771 RepID=A0A5B8YK69_9FLAO|nr:DUF1080 domain-containing protein [Antarcticibacterium arcticum]
MKKMKKFPILIFLLGAFIFSHPLKAQNTSIYAQEGYVSLFNGKDLSGWKIPDGDGGHWSVIDGVIDYDARSEAKGDKSLWSEKEYKDFKLHVEWRFKGYGDHLFPLPTILPTGEYLLDEKGNIIEPLGPNSDSGILLKGAGQVQMWCWSVGSGELWTVRNDKSLPAEVRAAAVPSENADQPVGQWNSFDIILKGKRITVILNGITVIDNALYPSMEETGPIGLQHHGGIHKETGKMTGASSLVQFRNIWIKEL